MESRVQQAVENYTKNGCNCAQAVAMTYADLLSIDKLELLSSLMGFGSGMGSRKATCGAIVGAVYLASKSVEVKDDSRESLMALKKEVYKKSSAITESFYQQQHTTVCQDLKDPKAITFLPCLECIARSAKLAEDIVFEGMFE